MSGAQKFPDPFAVSEVFCNSFWAHSVDAGEIGLTFGLTEKEGSSNPDDYVVAGRIRIGTKTAIFLRNVLNQQNALFGPAAKLKINPIAQ